MSEQQTVSLKDSTIFLSRGPFGGRITSFYLKSNNTMIAQAIIGFTGGTSRVYYTRRDELSYNFVSREKFIEYLLSQSKYIAEWLLWNEI